MISDGKPFAKFEHEFSQKVRPSSLIKHFPAGEETARIVAYAVSPLASATTGLVRRLEGDHGAKHAARRLASGSRRTVSLPSEPPWQSYGNGIAESLVATLEPDYFGSSFPAIRAAKLMAFDYIEAIYNHRRSFLGYRRLSTWKNPAPFESTTRHLNRSRITQEPSPRFQGKLSEHVLLIRRLHSPATRPVNTSAIDEGSGTTVEAERSETVITDVT